MSIQTTAQLIKLARKEGMELAAQIIERESDRVMRQAEKAHDAEDPDYDEYERLEFQASYLHWMAKRIRNAKHRPHSSRQRS